MKKSTYIAVLIAIIAVVWVLSGALVPASEGDAASNVATATEDSALTQVRIREIKAEPFTKDIIVTGRSFASRTVELKAEIDGQVVEVPVDKGTLLEEGQALAKLEEQDREARLAEAKERVKQRQIEYNASKALENKGFNSKVRLAQAAADLEQAKADLKKSEIDLENTVITAPFAGTVFEQDIEIGDYVRTGDALFTIVDLDPVEIRGFVTEQQVAELALGREARVEFVGGMVAKGPVTYIAPAVDPATRTFAIEISLPNEQGKMVDGQTVQIAIPAEEQSFHKISPSVLSLDDDGRIGVKVVDAENIVQFVPISIIADKPGFMMVGGLKDTVKLITVGQDFVTTGQTVEPVAATGDGLL